MTTLMERAVKAVGPQRLADSFTPAEWEGLRYHWPAWAREKQLPPPGDWRVWYLKAGRGFGKTRAGAEWVRARQGTGSGYIALVGQTPADVRDVMIEGESGILAVCPPDNRPLYEPSKRRLTWPNGAKAFAYSGANPDEMRGPQSDTVWIDELASFDFAQETWDNALMGLRLGNDPRALITSTPKPKSILKAIEADAHTVTVKGSSYENKANLPRQFFDAIIARYEGTRTGLQEIYAQDMEEAEGALWKRHYFRYAEPNMADMVRVVVAIDPAVTATEGSDETGIVVVSQAANGRLWVLADRSGRYSPDGWAQRAIDAYHEFKADRIVAEVNNGGDMVAHTLHTADKTVAYRAVHASRGKRVRAEPVAALYEQGKVMHAMPFLALEDQLCGWSAGSEKSPDRLDALVWACSGFLGGVPQRSEIHQTVYALRQRSDNPLGLDYGNPKYLDRDRP